MNRKELIDAMAERTGATKKATAEMVTAFVDIVIETIKDGEEVNISGFGKFSVTERRARTGHNPQTGETITIEAGRSPKFKPGKPFKDSLK